MPYNNTPIAPSKDISGQVSLPLARVQKIINADPERLHTSKNAAFAIALATEMFIQHLATTTHNVVKTERKPRRNIQYRDVASAVAKTDNLEFLVDVVPKTITYKEYKKRAEATQKAKATATESGKKNGDVRDALSGSGSRNESDKPAVNGQAVTDVKVLPAAPLEAILNAAPEPENKPEAMDVDTTNAEVPQRRQESEPEEDGAAMQIEMEMRGPRETNESPEAPRRTSGFTAINGAK